MAVNTPQNMHTQGTFTLRDMYQQFEQASAGYTHMYMHTCVYVYT
jgi:hypothetical protein